MLWVVQPLGARRARGEAESPNLTKPGQPALMWVDPGLIQPPEAPGDAPSPPSTCGSEAVHDWLNRYFYALGGMVAYVTAAIIISCTWRPRRAHRHSWALRPWVWRSLLACCVARALMFVLQTPYLACSCNVTIRMVGRATLVSLQGIAFSLDWASLTLIVLFFEEVRLRNSGPGQREHEQYVRRLRRFGMSYIVAGVIAILFACVNTLVIHLEDVGGCTFWLQPTFDRNAYYVVAAALLTATGAAFLATSGVQVVQAFCARSGFECSPLASLDSLPAASRRHAGGGGAQPPEPPPPRSVTTTRIVPTSLSAASQRLSPRPATPTQRGGGGGGGGGASSSSSSSRLPCCGGSNARGALMLRWGFALFGVLLSLVLRATVDMYVVATGNNAMLKLPQHATHGPKCIPSCWRRLGHHGPTQHI